MSWSRSTSSWSEAFPSGLGSNTVLPEPGLAIVNVGKRDISYDANSRFRKRFQARKDDKPLNMPDGSRVTELNDQHAYVELTSEMDLTVGDMMAFGFLIPARPSINGDWCTFWMMITGLLGDSYLHVLNKPCPKTIHLFILRGFRLLKSQPKTRVASTAPANWEMMNAGACPGKIPLNVFENFWQWSLPGWQNWSMPWTSRPRWCKVPPNRARIQDAIVRLENRHQQSKCRNQFRKPLGWTCPFLQGELDQFFLKHKMRGPYPRQTT